MILDLGSLIGRLFASTVQNEWADCTAVFKPDRETAQDETCRAVRHVNLEARSRFAVRNPCD